jgi:TrpR family trp operon transcriptional repressor
MTPDTLELAQAFAGINDVSTMKKFFGEIFTEAERRDFTLRWRLMKMLHQNIPQREIATLLGVSLCKITRGAKIVKDQGSVTRSLLERQPEIASGI